MRPERDSCPANSYLGHYRDLELAKDCQQPCPRMHLLPPAHQPLHKTKTSIFFEGRVAMDVARLRPFLFDPFLAQRPQEATPFSFFIAPTLTNCSLFLE